MLQHISPVGETSDQAIERAVHDMHLMWPAIEVGAELPDRGPPVVQPVDADVVVDQRESEPSPSTPCLGAGLSSTSAIIYHSIF